MRNQLTLIALICVSLAGLFVGIFNPLNSNNDEVLLPEQTKTEPLQSASALSLNLPITTDRKISAELADQAIQKEVKENLDCTNPELWWSMIFEHDEAIANWLIEHGYSKQYFPVYGVALTGEPSYTDYDDATLLQLDSFGDKLASVLLAERVHLNAFNNQKHVYNLREMNLLLADKAIENYRLSIVKGNFSNISRLSSLYREKYLYHYYVDNNSKQWKANPRKEYQSTQLLINSLTWLKFGLMLNDPVIKRQLAQNSDSFKSLNQTEVLQAEDNAKKQYLQLQSERLQLGLNWFEFEQAPALESIFDECN